ncbi:gastrula zinc finger protein xFG20-1-like [Pempheris klunzingeri]|uniref:gastrula zinc finger protein xFG20-1-like n=1 Tax=Pempheris klunzingeri TaxID=3127111 RepID=UPI003980C7D7
MAEAIVTFQSQLSGVMETVFKAAMYEITRLVEDSFLEEVTRCREQVESLKRRLKWSESRRKEREGDRRGRCVDCGRAGASGEEEPRMNEKSLKQETMLQEEINSSQCTDGEAPRHEAEEPHSAMKEPPSPCAQGEKVDRLLKEEALRVTPGTNESQERWRVNLEETEPGLPGPSKRYSDQKIPKCHVTWEACFDQRPESGQDGQSGGPSEPLFQNRYGMEDLGGFDKTGYGDGNMIDMGNLDGLQGSPTHLGEDLGYMGHYEGNVEAPEGAEHQAYQADSPRNRRGAVGSPAGSTPRTEIDVNGEFSCLLINEEGYLQDPSILYPEHVSGDSGGRLSLRGQGIRIDPTLDTTGNMYGPSDAYSDTLNLGERLQHQAGGRGGRRYTCNQCSISFPDAASLKTHKQTHKCTGQVPPYSCTQCGKTFTQACNLKVHQRIHSGQGLHLCSHCGKGFPSFSDLKTHKCGQTGDKPYCCTVCGNKFSRLWNLKLHRRIHTQEKPHRCAMCDKSFTRADILKVHQRTHTGERPYCCAVCGLSFKRLDHLKSHQRKHMTDIPIMADLDSLIVTFQTQLSDVMETVVKTAMYEVTRLVEDGFLEEVKRRNQEVESLRVQLQWAERKLSDHGGKERLEMTGMCVDCVSDDVELSSELAEERPEGQQDDIFRGCGLKAEGERWTRSLRQGAIPRSTQTADGPIAAHSPESQATVEEEALAAVDVKEEEGNKPSCSSVHLGGWSGEARPESHSTTEITEAQPGQTQENSEELLRNIIKQDPQLTTAYVFPEEQEETRMAKDLPLEEDSGWVGLTVTTAGVLQNPMLATETDCDPAQTRGSVRQTEHELSSITADVSALVAAGRGQISSSASPKVRLQNSDALNVTIKQEVIADYDSCEKNAYKDKKMTKSGMASFSSSVKQHRMSSETLKQNRISHKAAVQEVMKLHSKVGAGLRLQADIQHLHRPMKRSSHALANSTTTAQSVAHSQVVNLNPLNRVPSTSKAAAPPLSVQRVHLGDKQATAHSRTGAPWVSIKTQLHSANSHHASPLPHPDSHPHAGPRHLLRCGQCGKCFPHPSNLKAHLQTHTGERPFCCSLCGRSFTKLSNLKAHRRVHTGERPYCCLACGKRFTQKCNLKRHQRIHLDV